MDPFSENEWAWLRNNKKLNDAVEELLEDALNVNVLPNGEPDLEPYVKAMGVAKLTIQVHKEGLLSGPYDGKHWNRIRHYLHIPEDATAIERVFWALFSFHCASFYEEDEAYTSEQIYMKSMFEMASIEDLSLMTEEDQVFNLNNSSIQKIIGKGVHARFVDES